VGLSLLFLNLMVGFQRVAHLHGELERCALLCPCRCHAHLAAVAIHDLLANAEALAEPRLRVRLQAPCQALILLRTEALSFVSDLHVEHLSASVICGTDPHWFTLRIL